MPVIVRHVSIAFVGRREDACPVNVIRDRAVVVVQAIAIDLLRVEVQVGHQLIVQRVDARISHANDNLGRTWCVYKRKRGDRSI